MATRRRSLLGAAIRTDLHPSETECVVRDRGVAGLRLELSHAVPLPHSFEIHIPKTRETRQVEVVWRDEGAMGVRFVSVKPSDAEVIPLSLMRDLHAARQDIATLRARLSRLGDEA
ncbi:hypothetical protein [Methylobacterium sp. J-068]|uniref:hypothetical protein n=1 Tax=Methylobacterium sp. J-068 TaxID=2836649 RepID=UPI001FB91C68|nr:hypothetical protein [Methylobacterium sp. J-068]MCJ2036972.1 hypothetical protein [Methylobacterium sp. J-068]